jgi:hypothetical protein
MRWRTWVPLAAIGLLIECPGPIAAQPAPAITSEALPDGAAPPTAVAATPTRRPTRPPTATEPSTATPVATSPATEAPTHSPPPLTPTPRPTRTSTATALAVPTHTATAVAAWIGGDFGNPAPLIAGGLLVIVAMWIGARLAGGGERRARRRARRTLATAMLLELRRIDAVLRRVVALDNPASFPSLDHPIMQAALGDLTVFRTDTAARIAQFHGALRGIQHEIGEYRDNPLRWAGRLAELNQLIKSRAAAACRAVPELIKALEREGATPPPPLAESPTTSPPDVTQLPPSPFGASEGDDWTL